MLKKKIYQIFAKYFYGFGKIFIRIFKNEKDLKIDFLIGPFLLKKIAINFAKNYLYKNKEVSLECELLNKFEINNLKSQPIFRPDRIKSLSLNNKILEIHKKEFLLGQILKIINKSFNVIDVGANTGLYSSAFASKAKNVFAFEASDPVLVQLIKTSSKYPNITIFQRAVSDTHGDAIFFIDKNRFSNSSLIKQVDSTQRNVKCVKLDDLFTNKIKIDLVKIDTEGSEFNVLKGMINIIKRDRPFIMIECWWKQSSYKHSEIFSFFKEKNYFCYTNLKSCGLVSIESSEVFENISNSKDISLFTDSDFLFAPNKLW